MNIQWYPGHMAKTRRKMLEDLKLIDAVCEIADARIPFSSRNPDLDEICGDKPRLLALNRSDQADPAMTARWAEYFASRGLKVIETDCKNRRGINNFPGAVRELLKDRIARWNEKGMVGKTIRVMVVGVPNVGKSSFINQLAGRRSLKAEDRPGVTRGRQWVSVDKSMELLDTPGILWPRFEDPRVALNLAFTGAVKDNILDVEELACHLMELMAELYPERLSGRYKIEPQPGMQGWELLEAAGRKRGFLVSGGEIDCERMARVLLDEYRGGRLGRLTLEAPPDGEDVQNV